jgi:tRNA nucleotidyltransferase (CCA-adding enzyme)
MALSLNKPDYGRLVDFYGGLADLKKGLIRVLHKNSFLQDPTRILRAVRFEQRFSFRIEKNTLSLAKQAILRGALGFVTSHRWREELVSLLKEDSPYSYIKRAQKLKAFSFISGKFNLSSSDFKLILRIEEAILRYQNKFKKRRKLEGWIIYLAALLVKLSPSDIHDFLERFGFKKGERIRIISIQQNITRIKRLNKKLKPHNIYRLLNPLSFESIVFFYAYYYTEKRLRKNIELFLDILVDARTKLRGQDLKALGYKPHSLYGKVLEKLLYAKIDKGLIAKQDEIKEASLIFRKLS